jgi:hypothetical protein
MCSSGGGGGSAPAAAAQPFKPDPSIIANPDGSDSKQRKNPDGSITGPAPEARPGEYKPITNASGQSNLTM